MTKAPVFVKVDQYKEIAELIDLTKSKIRQARDLLNRISDLKSQEDNELSKWSSQLDNIESSVDDIDRRFVEPGL